MKKDSKRKRWYVLTIAKNVIGVIVFSFENKEQAIEKFNKMKQQIQDQNYGVYLMYETMYYWKDEDL